MQPNVTIKFASYPENVAILLKKLRDLIYQVASQEGIADLTETVKWGEPSYVSPIGSTLRFDWKAKAPHQYCLYFNCNTSLVETFKEIYGDIFTFEGKRAIVFKLDDTLPIEALSHCIAMTLRYKKIKHLPLLGA